MGGKKRKGVSLVEDSLCRLDTNYIDLYQIHGADALTPLDETLRALDDLVTQGKVRYVGCSNLMAWQIMKANGIATHHGWNRFESVQAYYTLAGRDLERDIIPLVRDQQMSVLVWSPLAGGLLNGKFSRGVDGPDGARRTDFDFPPVNREQAFAVVDVLCEVAAEHGATVARIALAWLLHQPAVTSVIIGAKRMDQLEDNLLAPEYPGWMVAVQAQNRVSAT